MTPKYLSAPSKSPSSFSQSRPHGRILAHKKGLHSHCYSDPQFQISDQQLRIFDAEGVSIWKSYKNGAFILIASIFSLKYNFFFGNKKHQTKKSLNKAVK